MLEAIVVQLLMVYSVNVLPVVTAFSELAQFFQWFLQMIVVNQGKYTSLIYASLIEGNKSLRKYVINRRKIFEPKISE